MEERLLDIFNNLQSAIPEIEGIAAVTSDGRILSHTWKVHSVEPDKVAALAAAMLGLGKKTIQILTTGDFQQVAVQSTTGIISIYAAGGRSVLIVQVAKAENLGIVNLYAREAAKKIETILAETYVH